MHVIVTVCEQKSRFINNLFQSSMYNWENHGKPHFFQSLSKSPTCRYLSGIMVTTADPWSVGCELKSQKNFLFAFFCLISWIWWVFKFKIGKILLFVTYICRKMKWTWQRICYFQYIYYCWTRSSNHHFLCCWRKRCLWFRQILRQL